jgi:superfamily II RNA helicase
LVFAKLLEENVFDVLSAKQLVSLFSCFTNVSVMEDLKYNIPTTDDTLCKSIIQNIQRMYLIYSKKEVDYNINSEANYEIHFDLVNFTAKWCDCDSAIECKLLLQKLYSEKGIFLGEFVKALLKINNIASEMEKVAELLGNVSLLSKLREIQGLTLKYVVTNQSLYV